MYRRRFCYWLLAIISALSVTACNRSPLQTTESSTDCQIVSHVLGSTEVCGRPENIVVLDAHSLDLLLSLGKQPAGTMTMLPSRSDVVEKPSIAIPYIGDYITTQPISIGNLGTGPSLEKLTALKPDLIVGEAASVEAVYETLSQIAPTVSLDIRSHEDKWQDNLRTLAQAIGEQALAEKAIEDIRQQIAAIRTDLVPVLAEHPKVLVITAAGFTNGTFQVITSESFVGGILEDIGFELVFPPESTTNAVLLSIEALPDMDEADSVLILGFNRSLPQTDLNDLDAQKVEEAVQQQSSGAKQEWESNGIAQSLRASQEGRVYFTTFYEWNIFNGPLGIDLILQQLRQFLLTS